MSALVRAMVLVAALQSGLPMETIVRDNMSNVDDTRQIVAKTASEWAALWRLHAGDQAPAPKLDLTKRMVVAVFLGSRPTAGYAVEVSSATPAGTTLVVEWSEHRPAPGGVLAQVITSPAHLVSIPRFDGEITFRKVDR